MAEHVAEVPALDRQAEDEWGRLRTQLEFGPGPWIGFVFAPAAAVVNVLRERAEVLLRRQARSLLLIRPETPESLRALAARLVGDSQPAGCIWIEVLHEGREWNEARDLLLVRLNEHREALLRRLSGGLVFAFPRDVKRRVREIAPDLWSVRSIVIHLDPAATAEMGVDGPPRHQRVEPVGAGDQEGQLTLREARRMLEAKHYPEAVRMYVRAADILSHVHQAPLARSAAETALQVAEEHVPAMIPAALASLAGAELEDGDPGAAIDHLNRATELDGGKTTGFSYLMLGRAYRVQGRPADAVLAFQNAVVAFSRENQESNAAKAKMEVGDAVWAAVGPVAARPYFEEGAQQLRFLVDRDTSDPTVLLSLAAVLIQLAHLLRVQGEVDKARRVIEEALMRLNRMSGAHQAAHAELSIFAHQTLGEIAFQSGDLVTAKAESERALATASAVAGINSTAIAADSHSTLAVIAAAQGDDRAARAHSAAAVAAWRDGIALHGETEDALNRLCGALLRAAIHAAEDEREALIRESVELARRLRATVGSSAMVLLRLSHALDQLRLLLSKLRGTAHEMDAVIEEKNEIDRQLNELVPHDQTLLP